MEQALNVERSMAVYCCFPHESFNFIRIYSHALVFLSFINANTFGKNIEKREIEKIIR